MASFGDARERMVTMHNDSLQGLGLSDITVKEYRAPQGLQWVVFALTTISFISFSSSKNLDPERGGVIYQFWSVGGYALGFAAFAKFMQPYVIIFMVVVHTAEAAYLARSRLRKHGVKFGSPVWWEWTVSCFLEGFASFQRFDGLVREKEQEKKSKKH